MTGAQKAAREPPGPGQVEVWGLALDGPGDADRALLDAAERARADRLLRPLDRDRFTAARAGLRRVLAAYGDVDPAELAFAQDANGKPRLAEPPTGLERLRFNISHSQGRAFLAVAVDVEVGIDLEAWRPVEMGLPERFFSLSEQKALAGLSGEDWTRAFFRCWTRKEALLKASGHGLSLPLDSFDVTLGAEARVLRAEGPLQDATGWSLHDLDGGPYASAALAVASPLPHRVIPAGEAGGSGPRQP